MNTYFLQRGDLLFLTNYEEEDIRVGEIVVFKIDGRDIPIVHRFDPILENLIPLSVQSVEAPREGGWLDQIPHKGEKQHSSVSQYFPPDFVSFSLLAHHLIIQGDNNSVDDRGLYAPGQLWLDRKVS